MRFLLLAFGLFFMGCAALDTQGLSDTNDSDGAPHVISGGANTGFSDQGSQPVDIYAPLAKGYIDATTIDVGLSADMQEKYPDLVDAINQDVADREATVLVAAGQDGIIEVCSTPENCDTDEVVDGWLILPINNDFEEPIVLSYPLTEEIDAKIKVTLHEGKHDFMPKIGYTVNISTSFKSLDQPLGILSDKVMFSTYSKEQAQVSVLSVPLQGGLVKPVAQIESPLQNIQCSPDQSYCLGFNESNAMLVYFTNVGASVAYSLSAYATEEFSISPDSSLVAQEARTTINGKQYSRIVIGAANPAESQEIFVHQNNLEVLSRDFVWNDNSSLVAITHYGNGDYNLEYLDLKKSQVLRSGAFLLSPTILLSSARSIRNVEKWGDSKFTYECFDEESKNGNLCVFDMKLKNSENAESVLIEASSLEIKKEGVLISQHKWNADHTFVFFDVRPLQTEKYDTEDRSHFLLWGFKPGINKAVFLKTGYRPSPNPENPTIAAYLSIDDEGEKVVSVVNLAHYK